MIRRLLEFASRRLSAGRTLSTTGSTNPGGLALGQVASCLLALWCCLALTVPAARGAERPLNVLLITADDMNWDSPGWAGSKAGATPTLDALAAQSHRFINNHVSAPICGPSRAALMTGLVPHHSGGLGFNPIRFGTPTLPAVLKRAGYYTAAFNKVQHMKPRSEFPWDESAGGTGKAPAELRERFAAAVQHAETAEKPFFINVNIQDPHRPFPGAAANGADEEDGDETPKPKRPKANAKQAGNQSDKRAARKAAKVARKTVEVTGDSRVYRAEEVIVPSFLENLPLVRKEVAQYFTAVARLDVSLHGLLDVLDMTAHSDDTVVVFLSDHGMSFPFSKATVYANGTHSPVLVKYPGMPEAALHEEMVSSVDIMPTLLEVLAVACPSGVDGHSWLPLIRGAGTGASDHVITHVNTVVSGAEFAQRCLRTKDQALMFHGWSNGKRRFRVEAMSGLTFDAMVDAARTDPRIADRVKQYQLGAPLMFFDLAADPDERVNRIADPQQRVQIERLGKTLLDSMRATGDPQADAFEAALDNWRRDGK